MTFKGNDGAATNRTSNWHAVRIKRLLMAASLSLLAASGIAAEPVPESAPVRVMIVGVFHMSNPGHDLYDLKADDILAPRRQVEVQRIAEALARFRPNKVSVEWPADAVAARYKQYLAGVLPDSRNEVVQLGFRLAKNAGAQGVYSIDADGDFPFERLKNFADARGLNAILDNESTLGKRDVAREAELLSSQGVGAVLRFLNDPVNVESSNRFYRSILRIGTGGDQPGADLVASWYHRNFLICANLLQLARPGDRIVVFFGAGHAFQLRQCVRETPGYLLVEANDYLPR